MCLHCTFVIFYLLASGDKIMSMIYKSVVGLFHKLLMFLCQNIKCYHLRMAVSCELPSFYAPLVNITERSMICHHVLLGEMSLVAIYLHIRSLLSFVNH